MTHTKLILTFLLFIFLSTNLFAQYTQWVSRYNGTGNGSDGASSIAVDDSENVYVTGISVGNGTGDDYATIKYNSGGVQQWLQRYNGPGNGNDNAWSIAVDDSGNVYVTGVSEGNGTGDDYATIKYNSGGVQQWLQRYNGPGNGNDNAWLIAVDGQGNVFVTGYSDGNGTGSDYATIKYNSGGVQQWLQRYNGPGNGNDNAWSIAVDDSGNVYVTGVSEGNGTGDDYATIKYNSGGVQQWLQRYNGPGNGSDYGSSIAVDDSGNVYVTGGSVVNGTGLDYATIKYNSSGVQQWLASYNGPVNNTDRSTHIAIDGSGNVYVTGYSFGIGTSVDYATIKYNSSGVQQWVARYNGPGNWLDFVYSIAVDGQGNVYVSGDSYGNGTSVDYATIKYDSSGYSLWVLRYNGPVNGDDNARSMAVDGQGNVYVSGYSTGNGTGSDFATIKYSQTPLPIPSAPLLVSPANGATLVELNPLLDWDNSLYAESYQIQVSMDSLFASIVYGSIGIPFSEFQIPNNGLNINTTYYWKVNATNVTGTSPWSLIFHFTTGATNITLNSEIPKEFKLYNSYPNPFNPSTKIKFDIPKSSYVKLIIYDVLGREITTLVDEKLNAGRYDVNWDGSSYPSGVYFYRLVTDEYVNVKRMVLLK